MVSGTRAGRFLPQRGGYEQFDPLPLRPELLEIDARLLRLAQDARGALGRLDGVATILPNPDLFVSMYSRKESLLSSQIEGTRTSLVEVLEFEALRRGETLAQPDVQEVINHQRALAYGLDRLADLPLSNRLLREMHAVLMADVRGGERRVGEFRRTQNWIGPPGSTLETADFVPPPPQDVGRHMAQLERFIHEDEDTPVLLKCGLVHYQFETIHPFEDGNGRLGRLLITLMLSEQNVLSRPLLYLSVYLRKHRREYYELLTHVRSEGDYESWIRFFLRGVEEVAEEATVTAHRVLKMREQHVDAARDMRSPHAPRMVDHLLESPATTVTKAARTLGVSYPTAARIVRGFELEGLLEEITGRARDRVYLYRPYLDRLGGAFPPED